mmetsp:Transcript_42647/g.85400  ORF Transcript_42647/g.85400 Transcript_42647/m.85400 type:complete len:128 (-) Transcript_42647:74-457(-)
MDSWAEDKGNHDEGERISSLLSPIRKDFRLLIMLPKVQCPFFAEAANVVMHAFLLSMRLHSFLTAAHASCHQRKTERIQAPDKTHTLGSTSWGESVINFVFPNEDRTAPHPPFFASAKAPFEPCLGS